MIEVPLVLDEEFSDERYNCYHPTYGAKVFGCKMLADEVENFEIFISKNNSLENILPLLNKYLQWLSDCRKMLVAYFAEVLQEKIPERWYEKIEVFRVSVVINGLDDYGATITFGESIYSDHMIELELEKQEIVDNRLNG